METAKDNRHVLETVGAAPCSNVENTCIGQRASCDPHVPTSKKNQVNRCKPMLSPLVLSPTLCFLKHLQRAFSPSVTKESPQVRSESLHLGFGYIYMMLYKEAAKRNIHPIGKTSQLKKYKK